MKAVVNAGPLIALGKLGVLQLFQTPTARRGIGFFCALIDLRSDAALIIDTP